MYILKYNLVLQWYYTVDSVVSSSLGIWVNHEDNIINI